MVMVLDQAARVAQGVEVSGIADGSAFRVTTNGEGVALIPKTKQFEITFGGYRGVYKVAHSKVDEFLVILTLEQLAHLVLDELWLVEGNRFYIAEPDGKFDKRSWLTKLSRNRERKIFR